MKTFPALATVLSLAISGSAFAASYQTTRGDIIDPIPERSGSPHYYAGPDLEPFANLSDANLTFADLTFADLSGAYLNFANLSRANLSDADLSGAIGLERTIGRPDYNSTTDFTGTGFDPVAAGWHLVPEPTSLALLSLGGLLLTRRRRA
jgi:uncharacterized protein YjbI with pentapeptide repeats